MIRRRIRAIVVDLDDTLYLERDYVRSGFRAVTGWASDRLGVPDFFERAWASFERGARRSIFEQVLASAGVTPTPEVVASLVEIYRTHEPRIELLPDARALLARARGAYPLAAVTDGPKACQRAKATALGLFDHCAVLVFTDELGPGFGKPHPEPFRLVEGSLGMTGGECVYVADNPLKDFAGPRQRGWQTIRVRRRGSLHEALESGSDVDDEVADLSSIVPA